MLKQKNIIVDTEFVESSERLKSVNLEYQVYDSEDAALKILGEYTQKEGYYYGADRNKLIVENGNKIVYDSEPTMDTIKPISVKEAEIIADQFLQKIELSSIDAKHWHVSKKGFLTKVTYRQYNGDIFLDDAYMVIDLMGDQVVRFERKWFNPPVFTDVERSVIQPSKALFKGINDMMESGEQKPIFIDKIELGYRLDTSSLVTSVKSGEAYPYYRLLTRQGHIYYIEAMD